ncbi:MAG: hypothetical protein LBP33_10705 [Candidatus Adiutrix sp.]|jgi:hypothetical protein|nr:hypothetical protein [Candidatus Adiutrix sp.]
MAEVFSHFILAGQSFYSQINCLVAGPAGGSEGLGDRPAEIPNLWPRLVLPAGGDSLPFRGLTVGQSVNFGLSGRSNDQASGVLSALAATEASYGEQPTPLAFGVKSGQFTYTAEDEINEGASGGRGGRQVVMVVNTPEGGSLSFSLTVNRNRWSNVKIPQGLALAGGTCLIVGLMIRRHRRKFKFN